MGWKLPQHVVVASAGGTILPRLAKSFNELARVGLIEDSRCKIYSAQATGCAPIIEALHRGTDLVTPVKPDTIATSIAIGDPADGYDVIHTVRDTGGWGESATDEEIIDAIKLLAGTEGIFTEPAGGAEVAVTKKLIEQGRIPRDESIVISITGNGFKSLEAVAGSIVKPNGIAARLEQFDDLFRALHRTAGRG